MVIGLSAERIEWMHGSGFNITIYWLALLTCITIGQFVFTYYIVTKWTQLPKQTDSTVKVV